MNKLMMKLLAMKIRHEWGKNDKKRDKDKSIPSDIKVTDKISYGPYGKYNKLAIYRKRDSLDKVLPCIVIFHGGGFFYGTKEVYQYYAADLAQRGFVVINFNYRLAPENPYPRQLEDINAAMTWLNQNAQNNKIDLNNLFFVGDSAGGNLVYTYTVLLTNPDFAKYYKFQLPQGIKPKAIAINCGVCDFELIDKESQEQAMLAAYMGENWRSKYIEELRVKNFLTRDFPATYIVSASKDFLLYQFQPLVDLFNSKGIPCKANVYGKEDDESAVHVFHVNVHTPLADQCNDDECNFFKTFVR
ncbi:MAG: alpha/beta hydrolase [Treponema sp.]|nr:alpha/beta hydrolase [Treponema sp.]